MPRTPQPVPVTPKYAPTGQPLPLPHERDEATNQVGHVVDPTIAQAQRDIAAGLVDTDMRATPGLDAEQRERLVTTPKADVRPAPQTVTPPAADKRPTKRRRS